MIKDGYEYRFDFLQPVVELVYQAFCQGLSPLYEVEIALQRATFNLDLENETNRPRNHFLPPALKHTEAVDFFAKTLSDKTVEMARYVIHYFRQHGQVQESDFSALAEDLYVESKAFSNEMLRQLAAELYAQQERIE